MTQARVLLVSDDLVRRVQLAAALSAAADFDPVQRTSPDALGPVDLSGADPQIVLLDLPDSPGEIGRCLRLLRRRNPGVPVVLHGRAPRLDPADVAGTVKPSTARDPIPALLAALRGALRPAPSRRPIPAPRGTPGSIVRGVVVAASTGGPQALQALLSELDSTFPVPVLIVQHLQQGFTERLAEQLDRGCRLDVAKAVPGEPLTGGMVRVATAGHHMVLGPGFAPTIALDHGPPENSCRPAANVLFRSAASAWRSGCIAVVLTGMGCDGADGARAVLEAGGQVLAQDQATSMVWGMPRAVVDGGFATAVLPLDRIGPELVLRVRIGRANMATAT